jgi:hypothetical protein
MIDDPPREADALPTPRSGPWLIPVLLAMALAGWAVFGAVVWGLWLLTRMVEAAIAIGWPV